MTDDLWHAKREKLEFAVRQAVLDLFAHTGSDALMLPLDPPQETLFVVAGDRDRIGRLIVDD